MLFCQKNRRIGIGGDESFEGNNVQGFNNGKKEEKDVSDHLEDILKILIIQLSEAVNAVDEGKQRKKQNNNKVQVNQVFLGGSGYGFSCITCAKEEKNIQRHWN